MGNPYYSQPITEAQNRNLKLLLGIQMRKTRIKFGAKFGQLTQTCFQAGKMTLLEATFWVAHPHWAQGF